MWGAMAVAFAHDSPENPTVGSGVEDVEGVLEEERDVEGNDTARREVLSLENLIRPWACALEAELDDLDAWVMADTENNVEAAGWFCFLCAAR